MLLADLLLGALAMAVLILPGWLVARAIGLPQRVLAGFISGAVLLHALVLAADAVNIRLALSTLGTMWLIVVAAAFAFARFRSPPADSPPQRRSFLGRANWLLLIPLAFAGCVVMWRAVAQPLSGVDTVFRWHWLAEQMLARGT